MVACRGFDVANFVNELCCDYDDPTSSALLHKEWFPSEERLGLLLKNYLLSAEEDATDQQVEQLRREIEAYLPAVLLHWAHWCVFNALDVQKPSSFDYLLAGYQRYLRMLSLLGEQTE